MGRFGTWTRRRALAAGVAAAVGVAGCGKLARSFEVTNVSANRTGVYDGEATGVSATVANDGVMEGTFVANLTIDGDVVDRRDVRVPADENRTVVFERAFDQPGTYAVGVDGGDEVVVTVERAVVATEATVDRRTLAAGDAVEVTATVVNRAEVPRPATVPLSVDGQTDDEASVHVDGGASTTVSFRPGFARPGAYDLGVGDARAGTVTVADSWRQFGYDGGNTGTVTGTRGPVDAAEPVWRHEFRQASVSSPVVVGDTVYVGDGNPYAEDRGGGLTAIAAGDGEVRWRRDLEFDVYTTPTVAQGVVVVGTQQGNVYEESATGAIVGLDTREGAEQWRLDAGMPVTSAVATDDDVYVAGGSVTGAGFVRALDPRTGEPQWTVEFDAPVWAPPAVADGTVYVGDVGGTVRALAVENGEADWTRDMDHWIRAAPAVADGTVYVPSYRQRPVSAALRALSADDGSEQWRTETDDWLGSSPAVTDGRVFAGVGLSLWAFDAENGDVVWRGPGATVGTGTSSAPAVVDGTVYVGMQDSVYALAAESGDVRWSYAGAGGAFDSALLSPAVFDGRVYAGTGFSTMAALREP